MAKLEMINNIIDKFKILLNHTLKHEIVFTVIYLNILKKILDKIV